MQLETVTKLKTRRAVDGMTSNPSDIEFIYVWIIVDGARGRNVHLNNKERLNINTGAGFQVSNAVERQQLSKFCPDCRRPMANVDVSGVASDCASNSPSTVQLLFLLMMKLPSSISTLFQIDDSMHPCIQDSVCWFVCLRHVTSRHVYYPSCVCCLSDLFELLPVGRFMTADPPSFPSRIDFPPLLRVGHCRRRRRRRRRRHPRPRRYPPVRYKTNQISINLN